MESCKAQAMLLINRSSVAADGKDKRGLKLGTFSRFTAMPTEITKTVLWL